MKTQTRTLDRFRRPDGSFPPVAGGDLTLDAPADAIRAEISQLGAQITAARGAEGEAENTLRDAQAACIKAGKLSDPESEEFKAVDTANAAYEAAKTEVSALNTKRDRLIDWNPAGAAAAGNGPQDGDAAPGHGQALSGASTEKLSLSAGDIVLKSTSYTELKATGAFVVSERKSVDAVLVRRKEGGQRAMADAIRQGVSAATLVTGSDTTQVGALVTPDRQPGIEGIPPRELRLVDMITIGDTTSDNVEFVVDKGGTNNAAEVAEASAVTGSSGTKPLSELELDKETFPVVTIAHAIAATKRALADGGQIRTLIEQFLTQGLDERLDDQIAAGNGQGENIRGIANTPGIALVEHRKAETGNVLTPELKYATIYRAIATVRKARHRPTAIGMNVDDWAEFVLLQVGKGAVANQVGTAGAYPEGAYFLGGPIDIARQTLWGLPVILSEAFPVGGPIVGDFRKAALWLREGTQILASDSHMDFFLRNMVAILAEFRAAFGVIAPAAFCQADIS